MPRELEAEGRVVAAERTEAGKVAYCIRAELARRCFQVDPNTGAFQTHDDDLFGFRFAPSGLEPPAGSAVRASNSGTVRVCSAPERCALIRTHAPHRAFDEVYGVLPAVAISSDRVVVARLEQKFLQTSTVDSAWLDIYSVARRRRIAARRVGAGFVVAPLLRIGKFVYYELCKNPDNPSCTAHLLNPQTLANTSLGLTRFQVPYDRPRVDPDEPIQRVGQNYAMLDARGNEVIWVSGANGRVVRRAAIGPASDLSIGPARGGRLNDASMVVIRSAPHAGSLSVVALRDGTSHTVTPPLCPE